MRAMLYGLTAATLISASVFQSVGIRPDKSVAETLRGRTLVTNDGLPIAHELSVVGDQIVSVNARPGPPVQIRDAHDGHLLANVGTWGNGENEFLSAFHLDRDKSGADRVWVYDITRHRFAQIDLSASNRSYNASVKAWLLIRSDAVLTSPTWIGDSIVSPGYFYEGRLAVFTRSGRFVHFAGTLPFKDGEPPTVTQEAYQARMRADPAQSRFVLAVRQAARLEFFRRDGTLLALSHEERPFDPVYRTTYYNGEPKCMMDSSARYGYLDVVANPDYVIGLFSGRTDAETRGIPDGKELRVFTWGGRLVQTLLLPANATAIAMDSMRTRLYAVHSRPRSLAVYDWPVVRTR